jgi:hypothetical protein
MKPFVQPPGQPAPVNPPVQVSGPLPLWSELPLARQQELVMILSSLLLRHWPHPPHPAQEVSHDPQP